GPEAPARLSGRCLPAAQAAAAWARICAMAKAMEAAGAGGGMDRLRAQVFVGLLLGTLPLIPPSEGGPDDEGPDGGGPEDSSYDGGPEGDGPGDSRPQSDGPGDSGPEGDGGQGGSGSANDDLRDNGRLAPAGRRTLC